jgi:hypothetical protein
VPRLHFTLAGTMLKVRCSGCGEVVPAGAKFCPRCGGFVAAPQDLGKMSAPVPPAGILFLCALFLAPPMIVVGYALGIKAMAAAGIVLAVILVLVLILGCFF